MAGLLGDVLPYIYQRANALKRGIGDFVADPMGSIAQGVNYANDRAGGLLAATRAAADEGAASGGLMYGPANKQLAGILANAYNPMGITVYHGSPHKFTKFDSSKIGTGEGAQAYGHGLYLAESPSVAKSYADSLSQYHIATKDGVRGGGDFADALVANAGEYPASLSSAIRSQANKIATDIASGKPTEQVLASMRNGPYARMYAGLADAVEKLAPSKAGGSLYKVDLPDSAVARMLDWDKPLSQQAPEVRKAFEPLVAPIRKVEAQASGSEWGDLAAPRNYDPTGRELLQLLSTDKSMTPQNFLAGGVGPASSARAREMGIPGIRYLDGGSRGLGGGTSNFVVFPGEESLLTILERNGMPLPK